MPAGNPTHPAASLRDALEAEGWTINDFAANLGISRNTASRLLNEHSGITPALALALERIGWGTAAFWMRRQATYDLAQARLTAASGQTVAMSLRGTKAARSRPADA